jgi:flagellar L-ring protein precursor FlgH
MRKAFAAFLVMTAPVSALAQSTPTNTNGNRPTSATTGNGRTSPNAARQQTGPDAAQSAAALMPRTNGSLLRATLAAQPDPGQAQLGGPNGVSYFAVPTPEPKVLRKHDLVTIIVREESEFKSEGTSDLKKQADLDAKIEQFIRLNLSNWAIENSIGGAAPEIKMNGTRNFKGEATVDRTDSFTTRITAEIVDVKPNGTLVVQARTQIKTDEEEQLMILTGVCRADDVTADNTVLSTQLFDKNVSKQHKGAVRDTTKRGLIPKLLDALNPF